MDAEELNQRPRLDSFYHFLSIYGDDLLFWHRRIGIFEVEEVGGDGVGVGAVGIYELPRIPVMRMVLRHIIKAFGLF